MAGLAQEEQRAALLIVRDEELALESLQDGALTSQEWARRKCEIKEETKRRLVELLGEKGYYSSLFQVWEYARVKRAAELAGVGEEDTLTWVRLQEEFKDRCDRLYGISLSDEAREGMRAQLTEEKEQREAVLFGARHAAFGRFRDGTYWTLKRDLQSAKADADVNAVYDAIKPWTARYEDSGDRDARCRIASEGCATLRKAFPEVPDDVWNDLFN